MLLFLVLAFCISGEESLHIFCLVFRGYCFLFLFLALGWGQGAGSGAGDDEKHLFKDIEFERP